MMIGNDDDDDAAPPASLNHPLSAKPFQTRDETWVPTRAIAEGHSTCSVKLSGVEAVIDRRETASRR